MATLKAKRLQSALEKARNVGKVEEAITLDGLSLVFQNLSPEEYESIENEIGELDGAEYIHAYQIEHVCRSIVEIDGVDLRNIDFIEDEVPVDDYILHFTVPNEVKALEAVEYLEKAGIQPTVVSPDGETKTVNIERHEWLKRRIQTWGREAIQVAWKKFAELLTVADAKAKEGIRFQIPDETNEDKFRRLLAEAKDVEESLPPDLVNKVLEDVGYLHKSTPEELEKVAQRAKEFAKEQASKEEIVEGPVENVDTQESLAERLRNRQPLNQIPMHAPVPVTPQRQPVTVPSQIREAVITPEVGSKSAEYASIEAQADPNLLVDLQEQQATQRPTDVAELSRRVPGVDGKQVKSILDRPPVVGINPRFRRTP